LINKGDNNRLTSTTQKKFYLLQKRLTARNYRAAV
jgi:hypothetical protein